MAIKLVVGLGNPGAKYDGTRHNVGYRVIEELESNPPTGIILFKPESVYMNLSGGPVSEMMRYKNIEPAELLVLCDDFVLAIGRLRLRLKGSSGGHNGLGSILQVLGTLDIPRLRIGIGPIPTKQDPADFVLQSFRAEERAPIQEMVVQAAATVRRIVEVGLESAMNTVNLKPA